MNDSLFDYPNRLRDEETLYLLRAIADALGVTPFAEKDRRRETDWNYDGPVSEDPHAAVELVAADDDQWHEETEPAPSKTYQILYYKFDPLCAKYSDDRTYFANLLKTNPNDKVAAAKHNEAKSLSMGRNRQIRKMIEAGDARYFPDGWRCEFNLNGVWVPWRSEFCPVIPVKHRGPRKAK